METIFLEQWLHTTIRQRVKKDPEYRQFIGKDSLEQLTRADVDNYHLFKLRETLSYVYKNSSFYKELFNNNGIKPEDIHSLADLAKIPFTNPSDLAQNPNRFVCVSLGDITRVVTFTTSGTTGPQKRVFCTEGDIERMTDFMGVGMRTVANSNDVVQIILPSGTQNNQADLLAMGVEKMGAFPVKAGTSPSAEEQLNLVKKHKSTILFAATPRMYRITQELRGSHDLGKLGVKTIFVTSGYLSEPMRSHLRNTWNCDVHTHYGMTEMGLGVAVECHAHNGYHFNEVDLLLEIIDPQTGEVINDDREGEVVFTTLSREGTPLIRYRTHDISRLITEPCPCGATTLLKFDKTTRRLESVVKVGDGDEIYPSLFDELVYKIPEVADYKVELNKVDGKDRLDFKVAVTQVSDGIKQEIKRALLSSPLFQRNISAGRMAEPGVNLVGLKDFARGTRAKKMITDNR
jgi:phenylacetate-CoA ligase